MIPPRTNAQETQRETFERWLSDGTTWIGVFENQDLGHSRLGDRISVPYDSTQWDGGVIGVSRAPDRAAIGPGWRWILVAKVRTVEDAVAAQGGRKR